MIKNHQPGVLRAQLSGNFFELARTHKAARLGRRAMSADHGHGLAARRGDQGLKLVQVDGRGLRVQPQVNEHGPFATGRAVAGVGRGRIDGTLKKHSGYGESAEG